MAEGVPDMLQFLNLSPSSSYVVQVGTIPQFVDQWRNITSNKLCLIWSRIIIFSFGATLHYSMILGSLT